MKLDILLILLLCCPLAARAGDEASSGTDGKPKVVYRKRTAVSFDDAVVEGATNNPEGVYVVTPPEKKFGSLLKLRPNFHRELMRDALLLK
jgi:hypothetical protein